MLSGYFKIKDISIPIKIIKVCISFWIPTIFWTVPKADLWRLINEDAIKDATIKGPSVNIDGFNFVLSLKADPHSRYRKKEEKNPHVDPSQEDFAHGHSFKFRYTIGTRLIIAIGDYISVPTNHRQCTRYTHSYGTEINRYVYQKLDREEIVYLKYDHHWLKTPYSGNYESIQFAFTHIIIPMNMRDYRPYPG